MLIAIIEGGKFRCQGIEAPSLAGLCRALLASGCEGHHRVVAYRDGKPALIAKSIAGAAGLTVSEGDRSGPRFTRWQPNTRWAV